MTKNWQMGVRGVQSSSTTKVLTALFAGLSALAGCSSIAGSGGTEDQAIPRSFQPAGRGATTTVAAPPAPIDLTNGDLAVQTSADAVIIDTTTFAKQIQVSEPWKGEVQDIESLLEEAEGHRPPLKQGPANSLPVGSLDESVIRSIPGPAFPAIGQTPWTPPDPTLAVGPNHIVTTVNMVVAFYTKAGVLQFSANLDNTGSPGFFEPLGAGGFTFDPKCFYDHQAQRFVIVVLEKYGTTESWVDIAVSDDNDPNGVWFKYRTNSVVTVGASTYWVDYPGFGYDSNAYYVTGNLFGLNAGGFGGVFYRVFTKAPLLTGAPAVMFNLRDSGGASGQSAQHFGTNIAPFFVEVGSSTQLKVSAILNPITAPTRVSTTVTIPSFSGPTGGANIGGTLSTVDQRIFNVHWRNKNLYAAHNISSGGKDVARWYHMNTNNWPTSGSVSLVQSGNINPASPTGLYSYFPAICSDINNNVGLVVGASTSSTTPTVRVTGRKSTDALGTMGALTTVNTSPNGASGRWGDYFDLAIDPVDQRTFWYIGEFQGPGGWGTEIGKFSIACPSDFNGDGFVTGEDFDAYIAAFEVGTLNADFDGNGFVTGEDFDAYVLAFESGC